MYKINLHLVVYRYEIILAIIIFLLTGSFAISSKDQENAFPPMQRYPYKIAVTFDDGPHPKFTQQLLSALKKEDAKATFFIVGEQAVKYPELLKLISNSGHEIESHTMTHPNLKHLTNAQVKNELLLTKAIIKNMTNQDSLYYRPPGGQYNGQTLQIGKTLDLKMALWTDFPKDHEQTDPNIVRERVLSQATDGGVIILHSGMEATVKALPKIIKELKDKGYYFVTLSQLNNCHYKNEIAWLK
ncbi:MAG: polysaccharide deacetylase family protein [Elusimicrobia bacterium]|nr:polysaccharide deacetylase family protein [Candidatus Liberimonas magnetica]